jgi:hypothetical protein
MRGLFTLAIGLCITTGARAQTAAPTPAGSPAPPPLQILVYTPQGQPMALTPYPAPPAVQVHPLRQMIEHTPDRVVVVRHAAQPAIALVGGGALEIESLGVFEPGFEEKRLFGIRLTVNRPEIPENERTFYLEPRDVDGLTRTIAVIEDVIASGGRNATDVEYFTPDGFGFGYRTRAGKGERYLRASRGEIFRAPLAADGLTRLRDALEAARAGIFGG